MQDIIKFLLIEMWSHIFHNWKITCTYIVNGDCSRIFFAKKKYEIYTILPKESVYC